MHRFPARSAAACAAALLTCTACGGDLSDGARPRPSAARAAPAAGTAPGRARMGDRQTLARPGRPATALTITVDAYVREVAPATDTQAPGAGDTPQPGEKAVGGPRRGRAREGRAGPGAGRRWDAVRLTVANAGEGTLKGGIPGYFTLVDAEGGRHRALGATGPLTVGAPLDADGDLLLGESDRGWAVFSLPGGAGPGHLEFHWTGDTRAAGREWAL